MPSSDDSFFNEVDFFKELGIVLISAYFLEHMVPEGQTTFHDVIQLRNRLVSILGLNHQIAQMQNIFQEYFSSS